MRLLLVLLAATACEDATTQRLRERHSDSVFYEQRYGADFRERCVPLYALARSPTDSLIVHAMRPEDTYHGSPTCYQMAQELGQKETAAIARPER